MPRDAHRLKRYRGDIDGDTRTDRIVIYDPDRGEEAIADEPGLMLDTGPWRLRVEFASGRVADVALGDRWGGHQLLRKGVVDLNGDGAQELAFWRGGNHGYGKAEVVTLVGCQLRHVTEPATPSDRGPYGIGLGGRGSVACRDVDGDRRPEIVDTDEFDLNNDIFGGRFGNPPRYGWTQEVYRLEGAELRLVAETEGAEPEQPVPAGPAPSEACLTSEYD